LRSHIVITGTGRAGTTFLVELLTFLGLDTGFTRESVFAQIDARAKAGLEHDIRVPCAPHVVKSPWFCDYAADVVADAAIHLEHVFVPIRDLHGAAASRWHVSRNYRGPDADTRPPSSIIGGLWLTDDPAQQEAVLLGQFYKLMLALAEAQVPLTLLRFPRLAQEPEYLYKKLQPVLGGIAYPAFLAAYRAVCRPEWVHSFAGPLPD
jgi:hypothetical protein